MEKGEILRLEIIDTNENGAGIAKNGGAVVFIPSLVEGDIADVRLTEIKKNYAIGECVGLIKPSEHRCTPVCQSAEKCGGCSLSHITYEYENEIKHRTLSAAFRRAGLDHTIVGETVFASSRSAYRNKFTVHFDRKSRALGLYREGSNDVVPFEGCALCPAEFDEIISLLNGYGGMLDYMKVDEITLKSSLGGRLIVIIKAGKNIGDLARLIKDRFPSVEAVVPFDKAAEKHVVGEYRGLRLRFSAAGFRQVNNEAFGSLLERVISAVGESEFNTCADLYCGSGVIGLSVAAEYPEKKFYGIEINESSIEDAKQNAAANGIENIEFFAGDASSFMQNIPKEDSPSLVIVDPPRAGLSDKMREELIALSPEKVIYVSCNPQTLARDVKALGGAGYVLTAATPVNMFPMTKHVETVCKLVLRYPVTHINIDVDVQEMVQEKRGQATYSQIKEYVQKQTGLKVSTLYISQIKRKCGLDVGDSYNKPKSEDARVAQCPQEKEKAIMGALSHFGMI